MIFTKLIFPEQFTELYQRALSNLPWDYIEALKYKSTFEESVVARMCMQDIVCEECKVENFLAHNDENETPQCESGIFWSIAHKKHLVFIGVWDIPLWVDIEFITPREASMLSSFTDDEYAVVWWKTLENFYVLWTAKESILKYQLKSIDSLEWIEAISIEEEEKCIGEIVFHTKLVLQDSFWEEFTVYSYTKENIVIAICF